MAKKLVVAHEDKYRGRSFKQLNEEKGELTTALAALIPAKLKAEEVLFLCIGTDRSTGDSLGPWVGTELEKLGYNVIGTLDAPLHAMNLAERTENLPLGKVHIAIDACLGQMTSVGLFSAVHGPIKPGAGVGKDLGEYGQYSIMGVVNVGGFMEYFVLQNTRLSLVSKMKDQCVAAIRNIFPFSGEANIVPFEAPKKRKRDAKGRFVKQ